MEPVVKSQRSLIQLRKKGDEDNKKNEGFIALHEICKQEGRVLYYRSFCERLQTAILQPI